MLKLGAGLFALGVMLMPTHGMAACRAGDVPVAGGRWCCPNDHPHYDSADDKCHKYSRAERKRRDAEVDRHNERVARQKWKAYQESMEAFEKAFGKGRSDSQPTGTTIPRDLPGEGKPR